MKEKGKYGRQGGVLGEGWRHGRRRELGRKGSTKEGEMKERGGRSSVIGPLVGDGLKGVLSLRLE